MMLRTSAGKSKNVNGALIVAEVEERSSAGGILERGMIVIRAALKATI